MYISSSSHRSGDIVIDRQPAHKSMQSSSYYLCMPTQTKTVHVSDPTICERPQRVSLPFGAAHALRVSRLLSLLSSAEANLASYTTAARAAARHGALA